MWGLALGTSGTFLRYFIRLPEFKLAPHSFLYNAAVNDDLETEHETRDDYVLHEMFADVWLPGSHPHHQDLVITRCVITSKVINS